MSDTSSIHRDRSSSDDQQNQNQNQNQQPNHAGRRSDRPPRACTARTSARLHRTADAPPPPPPPRRSVRKESDDQNQPQQQCSKIITPLLNSPPPPSQLPRWTLRSMWELASLLNFLHIFRPFLNISVEFTAEELETALITPNNTLGDIHIPLLKAIPPVARMALGRATWVTVLCRKLKDWWHWVADGEIPIVASHGAEVEAYKALDPGTRVLILKVLCDIRVEQEDIRSYIDDSIKHGIQLSAFRRERIGGDSHGVSYWYEDDPIIGHRLYREIRRVEVKKMKAKGIPSLPLVSCQWETVATNLDEFQEVSEKLFSSKNRTEAALGKKLKIGILPEIEKIHKRKERALKKQHRQAMLLDNFMSADGLSSGRSLRDRKPVTYTFDDFDRSINEAIKITKRRPASPEPVVRRDAVPKPEASINGRLNGPFLVPQQTVSYDTPSPKSSDYEETDGEHDSEPLDRSNRRRQRPQRYSEKEFVEAASDNEADFDSDDDIVGEAVYDDEYLRSRKQRKVSSSSEGDEEYHWDEENAEEEEDDDDSLSVSEDIEEPSHRSKKFPSRNRRGTKLRSVDEIQSGLRRSKRATRNSINYRQYDMSDSETDSTKPDNSNASDGRSDTSNNAGYSAESRDSEDDGDPEMKDHQPMEDPIETVDKEQNQSLEKTNSPGPEAEGAKKRRFLDLNELAPGTGFDDGLTDITKGDSTDEF